MDPWRLPSFRAIKLGAADMGIVWDATLVNYPKLEGAALFPENAA